MKGLGVVVNPENTSLVHTKEMPGELQKMLEQVEVWLSELENEM